MFCPPQPLRFWITPACAGKRRSDWIIRSIYWDHPRVCGEKALKSWLISGDVGSPPRVRGKGPTTRARRPRWRITPAYAGKSVSRRPRWTHTGDHPRVCGEKRFASASLDAYWGSPPRVRGKVAVYLSHDKRRGITPAHAGKSQFICRFVLALGDHPRACGEKITDETIGVVIQGSPPRVRGKVSVLLVDVVMLRVTPACAGKS